MIPSATAIEATAWISSDPRLAGPLDVVRASAPPRASGASGRLVGRARPDVVAGRLDGADEGVPVGSCGVEADRRDLGREVDRRRFHAGCLPQVALDPVDAGRAGHALDGQRQLGGAVPRSSYSPGVYQPGSVWDTGDVDHDAALHATIPGPWGPFHVAATERGVVAVELADDRRGLRGRRRPAHLRPRRDRHRGCGRRRGRRARRRPATGAPRRRHRRARGAPGRPATDARRPVRPRATGRPGTGTSWRRSRTCPWGSTVSYGEIARRIGAPRAARAVGGAVGRNPIGLLIPCHRVIAADGTIGGYGGDAWGSREDRLEIKRELLAREGVTVDGRGPDRLSASRPPGTPAGDSMTAAAAPAARAVDVRRLPAARLLAPLAGPARLHRRLVADRPGRRHLRLAGDRIRPRRRPDPDGDGDPEPRRRAAGRRLRRPARPEEDHDRDLPDPGGHRRRSSRS